LIACFLSNISAKYYENPAMLSRVIAKNIGDVFLRHSVVITDTSQSAINQKNEKKFNTEAQHQFTNH